MTSVYQMMKDNRIEDIDVADKTFDELCCWGLPFSDNPKYRNYNAATEYILRNTEAIEIRGDKEGYQWIIADVAGFVDKHYDAMTKFTVQCCRDVMDSPRRDDNLEVGIMTVNGLMAGYFDEDSYRKFLWMMGSRAGKGSARSSSAPRKNAGVSRTKDVVKKEASKPAKTTKPSGKAPASKSDKLKTHAKKTKGRC